MLCNSSIEITEHFVGNDKMIQMPKGASKLIDDYKLSRYACYLMVENAESIKPVIAFS